MLRQYTLSLLIQEDSTIENDFIVSNIVQDNAKIHTSSPSCISCSCPSNISSQQTFNDAGSIVCMDENCESSTSCPPLQHCKINDRIRRSNLTISNNNRQQQRQQQQRQQHNYNNVSPPIILPPPLRNSPFSPPTRQISSTSLLRETFLSASPLRLPTRHHSFDESDLVSDNNTAKKIVLVRNEQPIGESQHHYDKKLLSSPNGNGGRKNRSLDDMGKLYLNNNNTSPSKEKAGETPRGNNKRRISSTKAILNHKIDIATNECMNDNNNDNKSDTTLQMRLKSLILHQPLPFTNDFVYNNTSNSNCEQHDDLQVIDSRTTLSTLPSQRPPTGIKMKRQQTYPLTNDTAATTTACSVDIAPRPPRRQGSSQRIFNIIPQPQQQRNAHKTSSDSSSSSSSTSSFHTTIST